jgi:hypothetical protein
MDTPAIQHPCIMKVAEVLTHWHNCRAIANVWARTSPGYEVADSVTFAVLASSKIVAAITGHLNASTPNALRLIGYLGGFTYRGNTASGKVASWYGVCGVYASSTF